MGKNHRTIAVLSCAYDTLVGCDVRELGKKRRRNGNRHPIKKGCFPFIPLRSDHAIKLVMKAAELMGVKNNWMQDKSFLDVGCGAGNICLLADAAGFRANGLDLDRAALNIAKKRVTDHSRFFCIDALQFDSYHKYDVIYFWRPISDAEKMAELEARIMADMKVGAIAVIVWPSISVWHFDKRFKKVATIGGHGGESLIYRKQRK